MLTIGIALAIAAVLLTFAAGHICGRMYEHCKSRMELASQARTIEEQRQDLDISNAAIEDLMSEVATLKGNVTFYRDGAGELAQEFVRFGRVVTFEKLQIVNNN